MIGRCSPPVGHFPVGRYGVPHSDVDIEVTIAYPVSELFCGTPIAHKSTLVKRFLNLTQCLSRSLIVFVIVCEVVHEARGAAHSRQGNGPTVCDLQLLKRIYEHT